MCFFATCAFHAVTVAQLRQTVRAAGDVQLQVARLSRVRELRPVPLVQLGERLENLRGFLRVAPDERAAAEFGSERYTRTVEH